MKRYIKYRGKKLNLFKKNWNDSGVVDKEENKIRDFGDDLSEDVSVIEDGMLVD